ncbi:MAG: hypothetical protein ACRCX4_08395 [Bacteroidales bacterium]
MKKWILFSLMTAAVMSSCSSDENGATDEITGTRAISIDAFVPKMQKGADATTAALASGINIYAYKTGTPYGASPFMDNVIFKKSGTYWTSTPLYYWPMYPIDFFGYYPSTVKPTDLAEPTTFNYTVDPDVAKQNDVVTSYIGKQEREVVQMLYHHALSKISFTFTTVGGSGLNVTVESVSMKNIPMSATFALDTTAKKVPDYFKITNQAPVSPSTGIAKYTLKTPLVVTAGASNVTSAPVTGFYLIPHALVNWTYDAATAYPMTGTYINIYGSFTGVTDYVGNIAIPITTKAWQPGYHYTYNIVFGNAGGATGGGGYNPDKGTDGGKKPEQILMPIQVNVSVDEWIPVDEPSVDL